MIHLPFDNNVQQQIVKKFIRLIDLCRYPVFYTTIRRVVKGQVLLAASLYYKFLQYETLPLMGDESWVRPKT